jgi:transglutaminase-like putative cysteine protease/lipoprotein NlpI
VKCHTQSEFSTGKPFRSLVLCLVLWSTLLAASHAQSDDTQKPQAKEVKLAENAFVRSPVMPAWADQTPTIPDGNDKSAFVLRLADLQYRLDQQVSVFAHYALQANETSAISQLGQYEIGFYADYQQVQLHMLRVRRGTQVIDKLMGADIRFLRREPELDYGIYGGLVTAAIVVDDIRVGDTLEVAYTTVGKNPVFGKRFADTATWDTMYPTLRRRITLDMPSDRRIRHQVVGNNKSGMPQAKEKRANGRRIVQYDATDLPAIDYEKFVPTDSMALRFIQFSEYESWQDVAKWATELFEVETSANTLRDALASARGAKGKREAAVKALEFVQNEIRYLSVSLGENSHKPYSPAQVLTRRYGDCKDKSLLLVSMLRQLGMDAAPVLVSTYYKKGLNQMLPSPLIFDHAIVRVTIDGKTYFLDPTRLGQSGNLDKMGQAHVNAQVLVVMPKSDNLVTIPQSEDEALYTNIRIERVTVKSMNEPVEMSVQLQYAGVEAEQTRQGLARMTKQQIRKSFDGNVSKQYPNAELLSDPVITDNTAENQLEIVLQYRIPDFFEAGQEKWLFHYQPINLRNMFYIPEKAKRVFPLAVPYYPSVNRYQLDVTLPVEFDARYKPSYRKLENSTFLLSESLAFTGRVFRATVELKMLSDRVDANETPVYMTNLNKASDYYNGSINVKKTDLKSANENTAAQLPFKQRTVERLEHVVKSTSQFIDNAKLTGRDASSALCERALASAYLGHTNEATVDMQSVQRVTFSSPEAARCRAEVAFALGDFKESDSGFSRAMALGLKDSSINFQRGVANYFIGNNAVAKDDFEQALKMAGTPAGKIRANIWRALAVKRNGKQVDSNVTDAVAAKPDADDAWLNIALDMISKRKQPEALMQAVHRQSGDDLEISLAEAYFYVGELYLLEGDKFRARAYFKQAVDKGALTSIFHSAAQHEYARLDSAKK